MTIAETMDLNKNKRLLTGASPRGLWLLTDGNHIILSMFKIGDTVRIEWKTQDSKNMNIWANVKIECVSYFEDGIRILIWLNGHCRYIDLDKINSIKVLKEKEDGRDVHNDSTLQGEADIHS